MTTPTDMIFFATIPPKTKTQRLQKDKDKDKDTPLQPDKLFTTATDMSFFATIPPLQCFDKDTIKAFIWV